MTFARAFRVVIVVWFAGAVVAGAWTIAEAGPGAAPSCSQACQQRVQAKQRERHYQRVWSSAPASMRAHLRRIAQCESGGNHRAVSPSGQYRGLVQMDYQTWASVGGKGDPAAASRWEQWSRAVRLYRMRGPQPWPTCGHAR